MSEVVTIAGIAAGGDGVGRLADGRAVFVPRTVPGDAVELRRDVQLHKSFARGEVSEIVTAGPARVTPPCGHYVEDYCGGCQLQHLAYDAQLAAKRAIVGDALRRIGKLDVPDPEIVEAIDEWRYRKKISLAVGRADRRTGGPADGPVIGLHPYGHPAQVFSLADCHIAGAGSITVHGQFFERESPGIVGPRQLTVSRQGALVASVQQGADLTRFRFERGSRLRVKIVKGNDDGSVQKGG